MEVLVNLFILATIITVIISFCKRIKNAWAFSKKQKQEDEKPVGYSTKNYCKGTDQRHDFEVVDKTTIDNILRSLPSVKNICEVASTEFYEETKYTFDVKNTNLTLGPGSFYKIAGISLSFRHVNMHTIATQIDIKQKVCLRCGKKVDEILIMRNHLLSIIDKKLKAIQTKEDRKNMAQTLWEDL